MNDRGQWLFEIESTSDGAMVDGLVPVAGYKHDGRPPEEVAMMEKARSYRAHSVSSKQAVMGARPSRKPSFLALRVQPMIPSSLNCISVSGVGVGFR